MSVSLPDPTVGPSADEELTSEEQVVVDQAKALAADVIDPGAEEWERNRSFARPVFEAASAAGLTGVLVPTELGGRGVGPVAIARMMEELSWADFAPAFSLVVHNNMARAVATNGNQHLLDSVLPVLIDGDRVGAFLLTEPEVGSDAAAISCSAQLDGDEWVINGSKAWVTNASEAGLLNVYARTGDGHRSIVAIVVDAETPGVTRSDPYELMGVHGMGTGGFEFDNVRVARENTLIPVGEAFAAAMNGIDLARVLVGAMCCGLMRRALQTAIAATADRQAFGKSIADQQGVQWMLADVATDLEATRLLTYRAARMLQDSEQQVTGQAGSGSVPDSGLVTMAAAHAKKFAARKAQERVADCMQVMGAMGYRRDAGNPLPRHLAAARLTGYVDGATEIQNVVIARRLWAS